MSHDFRILVDVCDSHLAEYAVETAMALETSGNLIIVEDHPEISKLPEIQPFAMAVFDNFSRSSEEAKLFSAQKQEGGAPVVVVLVAEEFEDNPSSKVVNMSPELFKSNFLQLVAFCYISNLVRDVLADARKII